MRRITAVLTGLLLIIASAILNTPPANASSYGPFNVIRYNSPAICFLDTVQSSAYRFGDVGNTFEPVIDSGYRTSQQGCGGYGTNGQVLRFALYNDDDNTCWKPSYNYAAAPYPGPLNDTYTYVFSGAGGVIPTIFFNQHYASCFDTEHERVRHLSRAIATMLGLQAHKNCWATPTVMTDPNCTGQNLAWRSSYDLWNSLAEKYNYI